MLYCGLTPYHSIRPGQYGRDRQDDGLHWPATAPIGTMDEFGTEFPHGIGRVAKRELAANGYTR
jgi:hypothetical protein